MNEEKIVNKIIPIETIIETANFLEKQCEEYQKLFEKDEQKNKGLKYNEKVYDYKGQNPKVQYRIIFKDGKNIKQEGYNWFISMINNLDSIKEIDIYSDIYYSSNSKVREHYEYMRLNIDVLFKEDMVKLQVYGSNTEEQINKVHSYLKGIIENNDDRYNKTVKHKQLRVQSLCLTIGIILSYIIYFILMANKNALPEELGSLLNNKIIIIIGQWLISALIGNILGLPIMILLYKNIIPRTKTRYSKSAHKLVYIDDIEDYISHDEVQIGTFSNNGKYRATIEKIYKITSKVVLVQVIISIILFFILK